MYTEGALYPGDMLQAANTFFRNNCDGGVEGRNLRIRLQLDFLPFLCSRRPLQSAVQHAFMLGIVALHAQRYLGFGVFGADFGTATNFAAGLPPESSSEQRTEEGFLSLNSFNKTGLLPSETLWLSLQCSRYK